MTLQAFLPPSCRSPPQQPRASRLDRPSPSGPPPACSPRRSARWAGRRMAAAAAWSRAAPAHATSSSSTTATKTPPHRRLRLGAMPRLRPWPRRCSPGGADRCHRQRGRRLRLGASYSTEDGPILTNNHVVVELVDDAGEVSVSFNDGRKTGTIIGTDPKTDSAVIQVTDMDGSAPAEIGDSAALEVGQDAAAIGRLTASTRPSRPASSRALNRPVSVDDPKPRPTPRSRPTSSINPGNSGGPRWTSTGAWSASTPRSRFSVADGEAGLDRARHLLRDPDRRAPTPIVDQTAAGRRPHHAQSSASGSPRAPPMPMRPARGRSSTLPRVRLKVPDCRSTTSSPASHPPLDHRRGVPDRHGGGPSVAAMRSS